MAGQTQQLGELLAEIGVAVELVPTNAPYRPAWVARCKGLRAVVRLLPYLRRLWVAVGRNDLMHLMANSGWSWHLFALPAICIARLRCVPVVVNYRGGGASDFLARSAWVVRPVLRMADRLVVPSGFLQQTFGRFGIASTVVPNIVDLRRFQPRAAKADALGRLIVTRNLERVYDNETAIRAFAMLQTSHPGSTLTLAGSGPELRALQRLAEELGVADRVHFAGRLDRDDIARLYADATIMLNPSLVDNMPNSVLEALASGVPVVSTNVGGVPYLLEDGRTGLLVEPGSPRSMADAVCRLLASDELRSHLVANGLREVQRYTWAQVGPLWMAVYRAAVPSAREEPV
jgi:glycosyltransferase involved in cell wall biosynthesis